MISTAATNFFICLFICSLVAAVFALAEEDFAHWCLLPMILCGALIGMDALDWIRGRLDIFDPVGILGVLGLHFFFIAPILHLYWQTEMTYVMQPPSWPEWYGWMAILNLFSLLAYRLVLWRMSIRRPTQRPNVLWKPARTLTSAVLIALIITFAFQVGIFAKFGGVFGLIDAFASESRVVTMDSGAFGGMGWMFILAESFSNVLVIGAALFCRIQKIKPSWITIALFFVLFLAIRMLFGGLRGSRSHTVWGLFWLAGIVHFWIRPFSRKMVFLGLLFLLAFMYIYGFYKVGGLQALDDARYAEERDRMATQTGRSFSGLLLGDLGRSDVQAYLLYRLYGIDRDYNYVFGRTYVGALCLLIPRSFWPDRPPTKIKEGTEIQYGVGTYAPGPAQPFFSTRVYGLTGELILNFGPAAVPLGFALLAYYTGALRRFMRRLHPSDVRWLLVPLLVSFSFAILTSDSDNLIYLLLKEFAIPAAVLFVGSARVPIPSARPGR